MLLLFLYFNSFYTHSFTLNENYFFINQDGPLSLMVKFSCGIKLESVFKIVLLRLKTFSLTLVFTKAMSEPNILLARLIKSVFACNKVADK